MSNDLIVERNVLIPMSDGVFLAADVTRPGGGHRHPAIVNYNPYHKDGRGGRLSVETVHLHFAARGYACVTLDFRGLGNSSGFNPEPFSPQEAKDGHEAVEWIAAQEWCDGNVGMWGVSYPGITALSTAATRPLHLKAIVPIHATSDLYRGVVGLGGCSSGFWMRADWGPRMIAYNLSPPLLQDAAGRWAKVWAEHLERNAPWVTAFADHDEFDAYWQSRVAAMDQIACPTFNICGWRDLYADCTPRDYNEISAPKKLLMGAWKHEFPDSGKEAPAAGLWDMQRWFDRWLKGERNGIDDEAPVSVYVQGAEGFWRAEAQFPPARMASREMFLGADGSLGATAGNGRSDYVYDPTVGMQSLAWDPWTTALDPALPRDQSGDDARSLCFTSAPLTAAVELIGAPSATLEVSGTAVPLHLVVKLAAVAANGRSTLITTGWTDLAQHGKAGETLCIKVPLRATAYRLLPGERLRVAVSCADFPRLWPTPFPATLSLGHGTSWISLPVCPPTTGEEARPAWGKLQPEVLAAANDLGGEQVWDLARDLMTNTVRLAASKTERIRIDGTTVVSSDHEYGAAVSAARPDLARMHSTTTIRVERPVGRTELTARTVTTAHAMAVDVDIKVDGQPFWHRHWIHTKDG